MRTSDAYSLWLAVPVDVDGLHVSADLPRSSSIGDFSSRENPASAPDNHHFFWPYYPVSPISYARLCYSIFPFTYISRELSLSILAANSISAGLFCIAKVLGLVRQIWDLNYVAKCPVQNCLRPGPPKVIGMTPEFRPWPVIEVCCNCYCHCKLRTLKSAWNRLWHTGLHLRETFTKVIVAGHSEM